MIINLDTNYTQIGGSCSIAGRLGIGVVSPSKTLEVMGDTLLDGDTDVNGNIESDRSFSLKTCNIASIINSHHTLSCNGLVNWDGANLHWTERVISIPISRPYASNGYHDMFLPVVPGITISYLIGSGNTQQRSIHPTQGIEMPSWSALYYRAGFKSSSNTLYSRYIVVDYTSAYKVDLDWILIAYTNDDGGVRTCYFVPTKGTYMPWRRIPLLANWSEFGNGLNESGYKEDGNGRVHLRGILNKAYVTSEGIFATLPVGFRPKNTEVFTVQTSAGAHRLDINNEGRMMYTNQSTWVCFDNISFQSYK